jgi:thioester reductase-like protein
VNGPDAVLLTGATGFVGMELLARYLERTQRHVFVLVRAESREHARQRMQGTLEAALGSASPHAERVTALAGDITEPRLGLHADDAEDVAAAVGEIVHGAASVSFDLGLADSRSVNVEGTRRMLDFAELCHSRGGLRRFSYVSTAYVAGEHTGVFGEDDLDVGQQFRNAYEQSKYEAECLVATRRSRLPITVMRPSIIVGDSHTGWTASFNVLYWPLRALARGSYPALPARRSAPVDVVSVDYVADAIFALGQAPEALGRTFHLTASGEASSIGELLGLAVAGLECAQPPVIPPRLYRHLVLPVLVRARPQAKPFLQATEAYLPYFAMKVTYDDACARAALGPADVAPAPLATYFPRLLDFALATDWGRRPLSRAQAKGAKSE